MKRANCYDALSEMVLQTKHAANYANQLLKSLGVSERVSSYTDHPALAWRRSGLHKITGHMLPIPLVSHADGALLALKALSADTHTLPDYGSQLLGERARLRNIHCKGRMTAGGYGRLIDTSDGRLALNLVRTDDWDLIPAWLEEDAEDWSDIERILRKKKTSHWLARGVELGLAIAKDALPARPKTWFAAQDFKRQECNCPLIVDLSGLWAAPLASSLLLKTGVRVIKVESPIRPDGMRRGHKGFYDLINAGKDCVAVDFSNADDLKHLKILLHRADGVIEASRPRALRQLGIIAEDFVSQKPGKVWARLTAYGQTENRIGFGDDIAVSAGLSRIMNKTDGQIGFVGDAIADPINGLHLALAIKAAFHQGGGRVIDLSMRDVLRYAMGDIPKNLKAVLNDWATVANEDVALFYPMRSSVGVVKDVGADNAAWLC